MAERFARLSEAARSSPREQAGAAKPAYPAREDAHIQVCAGQKADLVGHTHRDGGFGVRFQAAGASGGADIHSPGVLVHQPTQSGAVDRARSAIWRRRSMPPAATPQCNGADRCARLGAMRPAPFLRRAEQAQMTNGLYPSLDEPWGSGQQQDRIRAALLTRCRTAI